MLAVHEQRAQNPYRPIARNVLKRPWDERWEAILENMRRKKIVLEGNIYHTNCHGDEYVSRSKIALKGSKRYPGVANAKPEYRSDPNAVDAYFELEVNRKLCTGLGKGPLDDHGYKKGSNICCADLVDDDLGITDGPELLLSTWTRHADRTGDVLPYEVSTLIKEWHWKDNEKNERVYGPRDVQGRATRIYSDLILWENGYRSKNPMRPFTMSGLATTIEREFRSHAHISGIRRLLEYLHHADTIQDYDSSLTLEQNDGRTRPLEIVRFIRLGQQMYDQSVREVFLNQTVMPILRDIAWEAVRFHQEAKAYKPQYEEVRIRDTNVTILCTLIKSDSPRIAKIARKKGADLIVVTNSRGQVQVITRNRQDENGCYRPYISLARVTGRMRKFELHAREEPLPEGMSDEQWSEPGTLEASKLWYYMKEGETLMNGSNQAATGVEPTKLHPHFVYRIAKWNVELAPPDAVGEVGLDSADDRDPLDVEEGTVVLSGETDEAYEEDEAESSEVDSSGDSDEDSETGEEESDDEVEGEEGEEEGSNGQSASSDETVH